MNTELAPEAPRPLRFQQAAQLEARPCHIKGVHGSGPALFSLHLRREKKRTLFLLTARPEDAERLHDDLCSLDPGASIVQLSAPESSPYDATRPDRSSAMARAGALAQIDQSQVDYVIVTARAWIRKAPSPQTLATGTLVLQVGENLDHTALSQCLEWGGYSRMPLVEDPGTFTIRGDIVDLWPATSRGPLRIETEFDEITSIRPYDPETQRSGAQQAPVKSVHISPAREAVITSATQTRARDLIQSLADEANLPSSRARTLIEDVTSGSTFAGSAAYLPAYAELEPIGRRLENDTPLVVVDPENVLREMREDYSSAQHAFEQDEGGVHFELQSHYATEHELGTDLAKAHPYCLHKVALGGEEMEGFFGLAHTPLSVPTVESSSQSELQKRLNGARKTEGQKAGLDPLIAQIEAWQAENYCITLTARVQTQTDRLCALLEHRGLVIRSDRPNLSRPTPAALHVVTAPLAQGLVAPFEGLVLVTEEEVFGRRQHRTVRRASVAIKQALDDLRTLKPGDLIVHVQHGIGRYLGLQHQSLGDTAVDLMCLEYAGGDKLFLPVYRLNQVQKFAGENSPKLDKLGGVSFSKTKSRVRKKVRIMADQLLRLYAERKAVRRPPLSAPGDEYSAFEAAFPFEETPDQAGAIADVLTDLQSELVMDRLVCGDVGFGKTEVALRATFLAAHAGRQVALLCPTTVLAEQHLRTFQDRLADTGIEIRGMSRFQSRKSQTETLAGLKTGQVDVVIGTHRLLSKDVYFKNLGLLVVDEEQRFGVTHKERLKDLRKSVDVLTLSATPIPRTLSLAVSGMRDMSVISTPPQERRAIRTFTARFDENLIVDAITREINRGGQVFYVYNRVETIYERAEMLKRLMPHVRVAVGHGQMTEKELEKTMLGFINGDFDVLCATAIIESGLDIRRANTMIIDRADQFGLSQLYQLRGRVGRSSDRAYCYLMVPPDAKLSSESKARIEALERYTELGSGFHVATMDMEIRGAGELLGADQSGFMTQVGFELFSQMLEEATAELSGKEYVTEVDPELSIDVEALLPESYVEDIGVRLSLYKKYAAAEDESDILRLNEELSDRFGTPPAEARRFAEVMRLKTDLRKIRALGLSATKKTATLHLREDTPLSAEKLVPFLAASKGLYSLSPDGRLSRRAPVNAPQEDGLKHADKLLREIAELLDRTSN